MPSYHEVRLYLEGLWLLIRGDARGLQRFDISDLGVLRSFLSIAWCLPAILIASIFDRLAYLRSHPQGGDWLSTFLGKMVVLEVAQWVIPALTLGVVGLALQLRPLLRTLIVTWNWFAVPRAYVTYIISTPAAFLSVHGGEVSPFTAYSSMALSFAVLLGALVLHWNLITTIMGGTAWARGFMLLAPVLCQFLFNSWLESMMGVHIA
jgi:hypothetical protein